LFPIFNTNRSDNIVLDTYKCNYSPYDVTQTNSTSLHRDESLQLGYYRFLTHPCSSRHLVTMFIQGHAR